MREEINYYTTSRGTKVKVTSYHPEVGIDFTQEEKDEREQAFLQKAYDVVCAKCDRLRAEGRHEEADKIYNDCFTHVARGSVT